MSVYVSRGRKTHIHAHARTQQRQPKPIFKPKLAYCPCRVCPLSTSPPYSPFYSPFLFCFHFKSREKQRIKCTEVRLATDNMWTKAIEQKKINLLMAWTTEKADNTLYSNLMDTASKKIFLLATGFHCLRVCASVCVCVCAEDFFLVRKPENLSSFFLARLRSILFLPLIFWREQRKWKQEKNNNLEENQFIVLRNDSQAHTRVQTNIHTKGNDLD